MMEMMEMIMKMKISNMMNKKLKMMKMKEMMKISNQLRDDDGWM